MLHALLSIAPNLRSLTYDLNCLIDGDFRHFDNALCGVGITVVARGTKSPPLSHSEDESMEDPHRAAWRRDDESESDDSDSDIDTDDL